MTTLFRLFQSPLEIVYNYQQQVGISRFFRETKAENLNAKETAYLDLQRLFVSLGPRRLFELWSLTFDVITPLSFNCETGHFRKLYPFIEVEGIVSCFGGRDLPVDHIPLGICFLYHNFLVQNSCPFPHI